MIAVGAWGGSHLCIDFNKIDLLPFLTIDNHCGSTSIRLGFLMLTFNITFFGAELRELNRKMASGELEREMQEQMDKLAEQFKMEDEKAKQEEVDDIKHISSVLEELIEEIKKKQGGAEQ